MPSRRSRSQCATRRKAKIATVLDQHDASLPAVVQQKGLDLRKSAHVHSAYVPIRLNSSTGGGLIIDHIAFGYLDRIPAFQQKECRIDSRLKDMACDGFLVYTGQDNKQ